ncbi:RNA polymerase sigma-70 factor, ECF subfamily [Sporobacter termitidis DSM 10068]|uniref:RNA polymerase sigma-70 factor, ECF subfamily n=1 Tax=Sporobacter termitidis DSM 10068 TaxID=1123282 RepID=A0A1M5Y605_9FIRM|nr:RNA polymerase sigma factor [Sporobacter termitidis]SHI07258.1 RNA polymerase sigma-70 factor, ECF subfamily [Sporobacter termitidis DSM 10068]
MREFEELCRENYARIYRYIFAMTGSKESAEDLIQDVFTAAIEKGEAFLQHENPPAYLYKTARNMTFTYLKQRRRMAAEPLDENTPDGDGDLSDQLLRTYDKQIDETAYAGQVLHGLDSGQRELYEKRYVERLPIRDISQELGTSEPAMRMRLVRLRRDIHDAVKELKLDEK